MAEATDQPKNDTKSHHNQDDITEDETPEEDHKMQEENKEVETKERDTEESTSNSGNPKERNTDNKEADNDNSEYNDRYVENGIADDETDSSEEENTTQEYPLLSSLAGKMSQDISRVDKAFIKKATLLQKLERHNEAFFALDDVYSRYADSDNAALYTHASIALVSKMKTAEKLELTDELLTIYGNVVNRLQHSDSKEFIEPVDHAFIQRADILLEENHDQEALDTLTAAIQRFNESGRNLKSLENFMFEKAELLEELGREEEALLAYDKFLNRFENK